MNFWRSFITCAAAVVLSACSGSLEEAATGAIEPPAALTKSATGAITGEDFAEGSEIDTEVLAEVQVEAVVPEVPGAPLNRFDLQVGDCFNEGSWFDEELDRRIDLTASIDCDEAHQSEVYFDAVFPAPASAQFPGETALTDWSTQLCYDAFEPFVGLEYELSSYEIGFVQPTRETFEHPVGLHRRVFCFVSDVAGLEIVGTAQGSGA